MNLPAQKAQWENEKTSVESLQSLREEIETVNREIQHAQQVYDLNHAAELQYGKLPELQKQLGSGGKKVKAAGSEPWCTKAVTDEEIARIISRWTGIPVAKLTESERSKTLHLDEVLHQRVVGQDEGVEKVTEAIIRSKAGIKDPRNPLVLSYSWDRPVWEKQSLQRHLHKVCLTMRPIWFVLI